jgi:hypothetical protein
MPTFVAPAAAALIKKGIAAFAKKGLAKLAANKTAQALGTAGIQAGLGALMQGKNARQAREGEAELERMAGQSPIDSGSRELEGFYNEALRRYQQSPYQTAKFIMGRNLADRSQANALGALTQKNQAVPGASKLDSISKTQANKLVAEEEAERRQDFGMLGQAGRSLAQRKLTQFDINEMTPFNRRFGLQQMKVAAANERANAGRQMIGNALSNAASIGMARLINDQPLNMGMSSESDVVAPRTTNLGTYEATYPEFSSQMPRPYKYLSGVNPFQMASTQSLFPKKTNLKMKPVWGK